MSSPRPARGERPAPLPGIVKVRLVGDQDAAHRLVAVISEAFTATEPAVYSGGRLYLEVDTRTGPASAAGGAK